MEDYIERINILLEKLKNDKNEKALKKIYIYVHRIFIRGE